MYEAYLSKMSLRELMALRIAVEWAIFGRIWWVVLCAIIVLFGAFIILEEFKHRRIDNA